MRYRNKLRVLLIVAGVFLVVGMPGMAAAAQISLDPNTIYNPLDGTTVSTADVVVSNINTYGTRYISVETDNVNLQAKVSGNGADTSWATTTQQGDTWTAGSGDYTFTLEVKGTQSGLITVYDNSGQTWDYHAASDFASVTGTAIPEFATLAIPMGIAILSGLFFLNHRKRREE